MHRVVKIAPALGALVFTTAASAVLLTAAPPGGGVIDFSQFTGCVLPSRPPDVPGCSSGTDVGTLVGESVILTATQQDPSGAGGPVAGLTNGGIEFVFREGPSNGQWNSGRQGYVAGGGSPVGAFFEFTFAAPVSSVGAFVNYAPEGDVATLVEALGPGETVLESYILDVVAPIMTPADSFNAGAFRGIAHTSDDIFGFRYSGFIIALDDLRFSREAAAVAEPATLSLCGAACLALGFLRRRQRGVIPPFNA